ncbi:50S ribosomal protein L33 [endosymbiont GvMRE of Glomus versiforme]|uniref:50S ribosomal protein L33 n=1 Tax=endosymbiont GvMRE of Glomus versiforme TaxID=2039283 RepID=UPI000EDFA9FD|nr:50S ribosomal protein L33 [endosymbiont GvMRE of Glomus versiforme]RHZ35287.1 50S ribosomal protein L33 [endosymbiont GvMRE of Glomus versiforme]
MRINLFLSCTKCAARHQNYRTSRAKVQQKDAKLVLNKYCKFCRKTQKHKEEIIK